MSKCGYFAPDMPNDANRLVNIVRILNSRYFAWTVLALPFAYIINAWRTGDLFYGELLHLSGKCSAWLLIATMAITPLRLMFVNARWPGWLMQRRRYFGVAAFLYALLHTVIYLDRKQGLRLVLDEARDFSMWTGWLALLIFALLAVTSSDAAVRWLKRRWKSLHRWVYAGAMLLFAHWIFAAFDFVPGVMHLALILGLEICRVVKQQRAGTADT